MAVGERSQKRPRSAVDGDVDQLVAVDRESPVRVQIERAPAANLALVIRIERRGRAGIALRDDRRAASGTAHANRQRLDQVHEFQPLRWSFTIWPGVGSAERLLQAAKARSACERR